LAFTFADLFKQIYFPLKTSCKFGIKITEKNHKDLFKTQTLTSVNQNTIFIQLIFTSMTH